MLIIVYVSFALLSLLTLLTLIVGEFKKYVSAVINFGDGTNLIIFSIVVLVCNLILLLGLFFERIREPFFA
jgi:hypothetical protein